MYGLRERATLFSPMVCLYVFESAIERRTPTLLSDENVSCLRSTLPQPCDELFWPPLRLPPETFHA